jgi:hypothetical protein
MYYVPSTVCRWGKVHQVLERKNWWPTCLHPVANWQLYVYGDQGYVFDKQTERSFPSQRVSSATGACPKGDR